MVAFLSLALSSFAGAVHFGMMIAAAESHAGIHGYTSDDLAVAVELKALLSPGAVHPAVP